jgi:phosphate transport system permease protein
MNILRVKRGFGIPVPPGRDKQHAPRRRMLDLFGRQFTSWISLAAALLLPLMAWVLYRKARPLIASQNILLLLTSTDWHPLKGHFGFAPFLAGTLWVTTTGMALAIPPSILTAIYLAEYAPARIRSLATPIIDLLAGIPSVVYGVWGVLAVVPYIEHRVLPWAQRHLGFLPLIPTNNPTGFGVLAGGIVLAVMVFPIIIAVAESVIHSVPQGLREASLALGATRWQTIKYVVLRKSSAGVIAAVVLGFSRAFGETMAVLMVVGNIAQIPGSIFDSAYPLTALIANNYGEMMSIPLYDSALLGAALLLLIVVFIFSLLSRLVLINFSRASGESV